MRTSSYIMCKNIESEFGPLADNNDKCRLHPRVRGSTVVYVALLDRDYRRNTHSPSSCLVWILKLKRPSKLTKNN